MNILVLYGGQSAEREVSLMSGREVASALRESGHEVRLLDFGRDTLPTLFLDAPDVVFIALHGRLGEDGTVQGLMELLGYPYVGSGVMASALAIDKRMTKRILSKEGVPVPRELFATRSASQDHAQLAQTAGEQLGWPLIIKPNREGSTIGLTLAHDAQEAQDGIGKAFLHDSEILIEQYLHGMEVTVAVVGEGDASQVLGVIEIIPRAELYDYESKYTAGGSQHIIPARLAPQVREQVEAFALLAYRTVGCRDFARVDLIVKDDQPFVLEVNTLPGMTYTSLVPDAARASGISFAAFLDGLAHSARRRGELG